MSPTRAQHEVEIHDEAVGPYSEKTEAARTDKRAIQYFTSKFLRGMWPSLWGPPLGEVYEAGVYDKTIYDEWPSKEDPSERSDISQYWDEGLITLFMVVGAALFLFPEPATSALGILLIGLGVIAWAVDWAM